VEEERGGGERRGGEREERENACVCGGVVKRRLDGPRTPWGDFLVRRTHNDAGGGKNARAPAECNQIERKEQVE
jgi:hypothetical protein